MGILYLVTLHRQATREVRRAMTTDNKLPDATQTEGQAFAGGQSGQTDATAADAPAQATETDWKGQVEALQTRLAKAESDAKANVGRQLAGAELNAEIASIRDDISAIAKTQAQTMKVIANGVAGNDVESLPNQVDRIQNEAEQALSQARVQSSYTAMEQQMYASALDEDGNPILNIETAPEFAEVRGDWLKAKEAGDMAGLTHALIKGNRVIRQVERQKAKVDLESVKKTSAEATEKALSDAGVHDLDTGAGAGTGGGSTGTMDLDTWRALPPAERLKHKLVAAKPS